MRIQRTHGNERRGAARGARIAGTLAVATLLIGVPLGAMLGHGRDAPAMRTSGATAARGTPAPERAAWRAAIARGRLDFATGSCISCHALYPIADAGGAIDLTHEGRRRTLRWLQHEIRHPTSQRPPTPAGQADDLAIFLSSLR